MTTHHQHTFVSAVGHCHPSVVRAAYLTNNLDAVTPGWDIDWGEPTYPQQLRHTLPEYLDTFLFCNSGCVSHTSLADSIVCTAMMSVLAITVRRAANTRHIITIYFL